MPNGKTPRHNRATQSNTAKGRRQRKRSSESRGRKKDKLKIGKVRRLHSIYSTLVNGSTGRIITAEAGAIRSFIWRDGGGKKILIDRIKGTEEGEPIDLANTLERFQRESVDGDGGRDADRIIIVVEDHEFADQVELLSQVERLGPSLRNRVELVSIGPGGKVTNIDRPKHILKENLDKAVSELKKKYGDIKISESSRVTEDIGNRFWDTYLKDTTFQQVVEPILDGYLPELNGYVPGGDKASPITLTLTEESDPSGLRLQISVVNHRATDQESFKTQKTLFALTQVFKEEDGKLNAHIESVTATGGGKKLFRESLIPLWESLNVNKLTLSASRIGGGDEGVVAWARYGFIPDNASWNKMQEYALKKIENNKQEWAQQVRSIVNKASPRAIREMVLLSWQNRDEVRPVLDGMLRHAFSWPGTLDLTNKQDLEWVTNYTAKVPPPPEKYSALL